MFCSGCTSFLLVSWLKAGLGTGLVWLRRRFRQSIDRQAGSILNEDDTHGEVAAAVL